jgi:Restriction endonuclease
MDPAIIIWVLILLGVIAVIASRIRRRSLKHKNIGTPPPDLWRDYRSALDGYERALLNSVRVAIVRVLRNRGLSYRELALPSAPLSPYGLPSQSLPLLQIETLLHIGDMPHGYQLIEPAPLPVLPSLPPQPPADQPLSLWRRIFFLTPPKSSLSPLEKQAQVERASKLQGESEALRQKFAEQANHWVRIKQDCNAGEPQAIKVLMKVANTAHPLPQVLQSDLRIDLDLGARIALATIDVPNFNSFAIVKGRAGSRKTRWQTVWQSVPPSQKRRATETLLYALCIRAAYLVARSDEGNWFDTIAVNARQEWNDRATGQPRNGFIASLHATTDELRRLRLDQVDPKTCFFHLKGISTPSVEDVAPVRPIFTMNKDDDRIVPGRDVVEGLEAEANLAAMPWEEFEHLVRQLFEWEFGRHGAEVRLTRASRDRGVDAIIFDPDPLRGGKFVIQAKRYTLSVDVAAVRDLYGTLINEGANRGILITTSHYGPDAYAFARDKPISLLTGADLIDMLRRHGRRYRIDLDEAREEARRANKPG